jgi:competence protein ComEC
VAFVVLHPSAAGYAPEPGRQARKENDRSCVLRVATHAASVLLTGDAEARSEGEMLARDAGLLRSSVLLVPHHGSRTSSTAAFIDAVGASTAVLSVGYRNRFNHPNVAVVERYAARGVSLRRTDREGALRILLPAQPGAAASVSARVTQARYWSERRPPGTE